MTLLKERAMLIAYVAAVVAGGFATLWTTGFWDPPPEALPFLFWLLANMLGEVLWLPAPRGRGYLSMATAANFAALVVLPPPFAIAVTALAQAVVDILFRHRRWYQVLFNFGMCSMTVFAASTVYIRLGGGRDGVEALLSPLNALPLRAAAVTYFGVNTALVAGAIALHGRHDFGPSGGRADSPIDSRRGNAERPGYFFAILFSRGAT
jgi:hypothetical protein